MMADLRHEDAAASFDPLRPKLMRVAYRMLGSVADASRKRLESAMTNMRYNEQKFMGVLYEDATACYAAMLQRIRAETGENIEQATVSATTTAKGRLVYVYAFGPFAGGRGVQEQFEQVKATVAALQAANAK